ncbi:MAG: hypothetical protein GY757_36180, partial [bacterium]|nr:hypothetical protein [bacterium]
PEIADAKDRFIAPGSDIERKLAGLWSEILSIEEEKIGLDADFFEMGGHSLKATVMIARIHKEWNTGLSLPELFKAPTIRGLANYLEGETRETGSYEHTFEPIKAAEEKEYYPVSSPQQRLYVLQQMEPQGTGYNLPVFMRLTGDLDTRRLQETFVRLCARHESLRTSFHMIGEKAVQKIHETAMLEICCRMDAEGEESLQDPGKEFIRPFDLAQPPLMRVELVKTGVNQHILMVDMHHIISDGTSANLLIKELSGIYRGEKLPPLRVRYKDYSQWQ